MSSLEYTQQLIVDPIDNFFNCLDEIKQINRFSNRYLTLSAPILLKTIECFAKAIHAYGADSVLAIPNFVENFEFYLKKFSLNSDIFVDYNYFIHARLKSPVADRRDDVKPKDLSPVLSFKLNPSIIGIISDYASATDYNTTTTVEEVMVSLSCSLFQQFAKDIKRQSDFVNTLGEICFNRGTAFYEKDPFYTRVCDRDEHLINAFESQERVDRLISIQEVMKKQKNLWNEFEEFTERTKPISVYLRERNFCSLWEFINSRR